MRLDWISHHKMMVYVTKLESLVPVHLLTLASYYFESFWRNTYALINTLTIID